MEIIKRLIVTVCVSFFLIIGFTGNSAYALCGNYGDIMVLYDPFVRPMTNPIGIKAIREARNYEEALLHMQIPQYAMGDRIRDEALVQNKFFYHVEICNYSHEYEDEKGMTWHKYHFTDHALQLLSVDQVIEIQAWIVSNEEKYKIPLEETHDLYVRYIQGQIDNVIPVELMIGTEYGQTIADYTDFKDFYDVFMNKHHYCVTVVFWSIQKSIYDQSDDSVLDYKRKVENALSDPQRVQSLDTMTAGRLIGMLLEFGLIEEY